MMCLRSSMSEPPVLPSRIDEALQCAASAPIRQARHPDSARCARAQRFVALTGLNGGTRRWQRKSPPPGFPRLEHRAGDGGSHWPSPPRAESVQGAQRTKDMGVERLTKPIEQGFLLPSLLENKEEKNGTYLSKLRHDWKTKNRDPRKHFHRNSSMDSLCDSRNHL